jgi:hypothetical protein
MKYLTLFIALLAFPLSASANEPLWSPFAPRVETQREAEPLPVSVVTETVSELLNALTSTALDSAIAEAVEQCRDGSCAVPARSGILARSESGGRVLFNGNGPVRRLFGGGLFRGRLLGRCR